MTKFSIGDNRPLLMGILNITPDSFYDGGLFFSEKKAIEHAYKLIEDGADIIDIGGESTRPGSIGVTLEEELNRILPILRKLVSEFDIPISVDTRKYDVAKISIEEGASIINDVSGLRDERMVELAKNSDVMFVAMHMRGEPEYMHKLPPSENIIEEVDSYFKKITSIEGLDGKLILDPGIGFGKNMEENFKILKNLDKFKKYNAPILIGVSRKSFIGNFLGRDVKDRLSGTIAANLYSLLKGADIFRVHEVKENLDAIKVFYTLMKEA